MDNPGLGDEMTYNFYVIHLADPGHKTKSLCNPAQLLRRFLTISRLRAIQDDGVSIMSLALWSICHDVPLAMREEERGGEEDGFHRLFQGHGTRMKVRIANLRRPSLQGLVFTQTIGYGRFEACNPEPGRIVFALIDNNTLAPERITRPSVQPCVE
jgi:hypothetical protein